MCFYIISFSSFFFLFTERTDLSYPPIIGSLNALGPAADFLAPGDRIHQIDGIVTIGLTNNHVLNALINGDQPAVVEIEYCLPEYSKCTVNKCKDLFVNHFHYYHESLSAFSFIFSVLS